MRSPSVLVTCAVFTASSYAAWDAWASCAPRTKCQVAQVTVRSCAPFDPEQEPGVARYVAELRKQKNEASVRALLKGYRGVMLEVKESARETIDCSRGLPKARYDESAYLLTGGGLEPSAAVRAGLHRYFFPSADANVCAVRFPAGRELRMSAAESCCDGDPNVPCLIRRE